MYNALKIDAIFTMKHALPPLISVAPMMDYTDRHARYFLRLISQDVKLYTEMITTQAIKHGDRSYLLAYHPSEHPLALQLGGSDQDELAYCAAIGESFGYDEINLNVGCPSNRVQSGRFGACLMLNPTLVANCVAHMQQAVKIPVTVKCRIGVDDQDSYASLHHFVKEVSLAGCQTFIIHARKAWLSGLSPKQNREVPPLHYDAVHQIKKDFSHLTIIINGGIQTITHIDAQLDHVDGVMIGRYAYHHPYLLAHIQEKYFNKAALTRDEIIRRFIIYIQEQLKNKIKLVSLTRHMLGLFQGMPYASQWRRYLSEHAQKDNADVHVIERALALVK